MSRSTFDARDLKLKKQTLISTETRALAHAIPLWFLPHGRHSLGDNHHPVPITEDNFDSPTFKSQISISARSSGRIFHLRHWPASHRAQALWQFSKCTRSHHCLWWPDYTCFLRV